MHYRYYVYILKCSDHSYYTGITSNLTTRIEEHQQGKNRNAYTYRRRPLELVFSQEFNHVLQAIYFEKKLKRWTKAKKEALINQDALRLQILSECRNATHYKYKPKKEL